MTKQEISAQIILLERLATGETELEFVDLHLTDLKSKRDNAKSIEDLQRQAFIAGRDYKEKHIDGDIEIEFTHFDFSSYLATL